MSGTINGKVTKNPVIAQKMADLLTPVEMAIYKVSGTIKRSGNIIQWNRLYISERNIHHIYMYL